MADPRPRGIHASGSALLGKNPTDEPMANDHYRVADSPDEHGIQQVWKRHRRTLRFFRSICKLMTHYPTGLHDETVT